jgi:hypothetical protein
MRDRLFGLASLALAGGYYLLARNVPASELADTTGPAGLPVIYAAVLAALGVTLVLRSGKAEVPLTAVRPMGVRHVRNAALTLAVGVLYVVAAPVVGYLPAVAALIAATAWAYGARLNVRTLVVAVSGAAVLWLLFVWLLGIPQPSGWWPDLVSQVFAPRGQGPRRADCARWGGGARQEDTAMRVEPRSL